jgi:hypothetical protein
MQPDVFQIQVSMVLTHLFSYDSRTTLHGAVAQLGERLNGIQEVESSILFGSTRKIKGRLFEAVPFVIHATK